jgi:hypothetical protein
MSQGIAISGLELRASEELDFSQVMSALLDPIPLLAASARCPGYL